MSDNKNNKSKTFHLSYQEIVDAFAQYLYDRDMLDNNESEGSLVFELSENNGAKIIVTPKEKSDDDKNVDYTIEHIDFKKEDE
tara:strand:- start:4498 stop:4746 length:249 start_codon:yes stop_codon:yes gene_type:complete